jgi:uncharacterized protein YdgA (DUF945 family)
MFKRGPIIVVGIVVLVLLAAPFALGMLAESNVRRQIEELNGYPPLSLEVTDYERGWLASRATIEVRPAAAFLELIVAQDPSLVGMADQTRAPFVLELGHGPILTLNGFGFGSYAVRAGLDPETEWVQTVTAFLGIPYIIELRGRAGLGTGFTFEGEIPPFEGADGDETYAFSGLEFSGHTDGTDITFEAGLERVAIQSAAESVSIEGFALNGEYELRPGTMALGTGGMTLDRFVFTNPLLGADAATGLDGLGISASAALNDAGKLDFAAVYSIDSIAVPDIGPVSDVELGFRLVDLDAQAVDDLYALIDGIYSGTSDPNLAVFEALPILNRVVVAEPTLALDPVRFAMDGEQLEMALSVTIDASALPTGQIMDLMDPSVVMAALEAECDLTASKTLLSDLVFMGLEQQMGPQLAGLSEAEIEQVLFQQAGQSIAMVVAQGMLKDDGDTYSTRITFADGVATVNGTPLPLEAMGLF